MARDRSAAGTAPRFHCAVSLTAGRRLALPDDVFHHAVRVRRLRVGDELVLFGGDGAEALARLVHAGRESAEIEVLRVDAIDRESSLAITLLQGISSGDRMDYTLQKAVELGVSRIVPITAERSIVRLQGERSDKRQAHWREVVVSACEQSGRNRIPDVLPAMPLRDAVIAPEVKSAARRFVLSVDATTRLAEFEAPHGPLVLLAGPEGGLTAGEQKTAIVAGFEALSLGPRVLRTETAAIAALAAIQARWGVG
jgi:16S rRNA (uracil1498-N3)-methyltransferase